MEERLGRNLTLIPAVTVGVGTMIGAGIFILPGLAILSAGPGAIASFTLAGVIALITALSAAELATAIPKAGGSYLFLSRSLGPGVGWIVGWGEWLALMLKGSFALIGFAQYAVLLSPIAGVRHIALATGILIVILNVIGSKATGRFQSLIVAVLVGILSIFAVVGLREVDPQRLIPFAPGGVDAVFSTTAMVFVSYIGFIKIAALSEEVRNPEKTLPMAMVISVLFVMALYAMILTVVTGTVEITDGNAQTAVVESAKSLMGTWGVVLTAVAGLLATLSTVNAAVLSASRYPLAMSRDGLLSASFSQLSPRFSSPVKTIVLTGVAMIVAMLALDVSRLAKMASVFNILIYALIHVSVLVMRSAAPRWYTPSFRVPGYPYLPLVGVSAAIVIIGFADTVSKVAAVGLICIASLAYLPMLKKTVKIRAQWIRALRKSDMRRELVRTGKAIVRADAPEQFRLGLFLSSPEHESDLVLMASAIAHSHDNPIIEAIHIEEIPLQTPLDSEEILQLRKDRTSVLEQAVEHASQFGSRLESKLILTHDLTNTMTEVIEEGRCDFALLGWGGSHLLGDSLGHNVHEIVKRADCDLAVFKDRGLSDVRRIVVPTDIGHYAHLEVAIADSIGNWFGAPIEFIRVVESADDPDRIGSIESYLSSLSDLCISPSSYRVMVDPDPVRAICLLAKRTDLIIVGASKHWTLFRMVAGSIADRIARKAPCSVLMVKPRSRGTYLLNRLSDRVIGFLGKVARAFYE